MPSLSTSPKDNSYEIPAGAEIEVPWNAMVLPVKGKFKLRKHAYVRAEKVFNAWLETKHPDYRIRYVFDKDVVELGARNATNFNVALSILKSFIEHKLPWKANATLLKHREMKYKRTLIT